MCNAEMQCDSLFVCMFTGKANLVELSSTTTGINTDSNVSLEQGWP